METSLQLRTVTKPDEVRNQVRLFNEEAPGWPERAKNLLRQTTYWVHDATYGQFAPAKFAGYAGVGFSSYELLLEGDYSGTAFDGHVSRTAIEAALGRSFEPAHAGTDAILRWGEALLGSDAFGNADPGKWQTVELPASSGRTTTDRKQVGQAPTFVPGREYRRRAIHERYGGQAQGGISTPARYPFLMLITGESGERYGYRDGIQTDGTFWYTGEGQVGDMQLVKGNRAILEHQANGKALHLFEDRGGGILQYIGEATCVGLHEQVAPDRNGAQRKVIVFELALATSPTGAAQPRVHSRPLEVGSDTPLWKKPLEELRRQALSSAPPGATPQQRKANVYTRSRAVRIYVLRRARGVCEGCGSPAPFKTTAGTLYLEPHHIRRRADGGPDHPRWVAALCPNCHRRAHYASDGDGFNGRLVDIVGRREPA